MPELPEIETVKLQLQKAIVGKEIVSVSVRARKTVQGDENILIGKRIEGVRRIGKVLLIDLEDELTVAFHFKMTGQLIYDQGGERVAGGHPTADFTGPLPSRHTRMVFQLDKGTLFFNDQRLFGWVKIGKREEIEKEKLLLKMAKEIWQMSEEEFVEKITKYKRAIKLVIMDQEVLSGVGNIYANDACWEAELDPRSRSDQIQNSKIQKLYRGIKLVLEEGIKYGGATAADAKYIDLHGLGGKYQEHFRVYDREGKPCLRNDGGTIQKTMLGGRGTYWCNKCQK